MLCRSVCGRGSCPSLCVRVCVYFSSNRLGEGCHLIIFSEVMTNLNKKMIAFQKEDQLLFGIFIGPRKFLKIQKFHFYCRHALLLVLLCVLHKFIL